MIGKRIYAWRGERQGQFGVTVRVDGITHCFVRWDDGETTHYRNADVCWAEFIR